MKIAYFIPGPMSRRQRYLSERAFPDTEVSVLEATSGPASIESAAEESLAVPGVLAAVPGLQADGFDAIIIGCFGDTGLSPAREMVDIPVIGPAQASAHLAAQLGQRFGILTVVDEVVPPLRRLMRAYGLEPLLADVRAVDVPVLELRERRDEALATMVAEGRRAIHAGADTLVLGCMTMGFLDVTDDLQERLDVPVVNPGLAALKAAEAAVALGMTQSRRAYPKPRKDPFQSPVSTE